MIDPNITEALTPPLGIVARRDGVVVCLVELDHLDALEPGLAARVRHEAARRLQALLAPADRLTSRSHDFEIVLAGALPEEAEELSQRLLFAVGTQPFDLGEDRFQRRTASIGWAPFPWQPNAPQGPDRAAIERLATRALFLARRSGSNQAVGILPMDEDNDGSSVRLVRVPGPDLLDDPTTPMRMA